MRRALLISFLAACGTDSDPYAIPTPEETEVLASSGSRPDLPPFDPTNRVADDHVAARLGQMLFFDKSYSGALVIGDDGTNGGMGAVGQAQKVSCQSCHAAASSALDDLRSIPGNVSLGTDYGSRNALGLVDSSFYTWTNWGGRFDSQWSLPLAVAENPKIMNSTRLQVVHVLFDKYRREYEETFGAITVDVAALPAAGKPGVAAYDELPTDVKAAIDTMFANYGKALAAYTRRLVSGPSRFDLFAEGNRAAITYEERAGFRVFVEAGCATCHSGPNLADDKFHAIGVAQVGAHIPAMDLGRYTDVVPLLASPFNTDGPFSDNRTTGKLAGLAQTDEQMNQFRTKSLRGLPGSGPYMHTGALGTLEEVVEFYDRGGDSEESELVPLDLTLTEKRELVAFLRILDSEPMERALLVDTSK